MAESEAGMAERTITVKVQGEFTVAKSKKTGINIWDI